MQRVMVTVTVTEKATCSPTKRYTRNLVNDHGSTRDHDFRKGGGEDDRRSGRGTLLGQAVSDGDGPRHGR